MNVKTVKRFSKRTVSVLLSILMVISLFTVCMVGTVTTVSAENNDGYYIVKDKYIYFDNSKTGWNNIYMYYGGKQTWGCGKIQLTKIDNSDLAYAKCGDYSNASDKGCYGYFFSDTSIDIPSSNGGVIPVYEQLSSNNRTSIIRDSITNNTNVVTEEKNSSGIYPARGDTGYDSDGAVNAKAFNYYAVKGAKIYFDPANTTISSSSTVYLYYGGCQYDNKYYSKQAMTYDSTKGLYYATISNNWENMCGYFFSTVDSNANSTYIDGLRNSFNSGNSTKIINSNLVDTLLIKFDSAGKVVFDNVYDEEKYYYVNSYIYNYRNDRQVEQEGNLAKNEYPFQGQHDSGNQKLYTKYNSAVAGWYSGSYSGSGINVGVDAEGNPIYSVKTLSDVPATPLYQGNFRLGPTSWTGTNGTLIDRGITGEYNFISVANGANRQGGAATTHAVALNLVDTEMHNNTITQNGVELPQFSDRFMSSPYATSDGHKIQWKSEQVKFPFVVSEVDGNTWYKYSPKDHGNRYYNGSSTMQIGKDVIGYNDLKGYFPFIPINENI